MKNKVKGVAMENGSENGSENVVPFQPSTGSTNGGQEAPKHPKMSEEDRLNLELAKSRKETAMAMAKEAVAKSEVADIAYKYIILQLYMRYGLDQNDAISEDGSLIKGGAAQVAQQSQGQTAPQTR
jgi:hypothetical protein